MNSVIVFDFDGVIVDSNEIKRQTFYELFGANPSYKKCVDGVLSKYEGEDRYILINNIAECIKRKKDYTGVYKVEELIKSYTDITREKIIKCEEIKGSTNAIKILSKNYPLYINSATPEDALVDILKGRRLLKYFTGIFGKPHSKEENLKKVMRIEKVLPENIIIIGDGKDDYILSLKYNIPFIGVKSNGNSIRNLNIKIIVKDMTNIVEKINQLSRNKRQNDKKL